MSFRRRVVLLAAGAVAAAVVIASVVVYVVTAGELRGQIDASLRAKLTPGPQAVRFQASVSPSHLAKLAKEGKLPLEALGQIGASVPGVPVVAPAGDATAPVGGTTVVRGPVGGSESTHVAKGPNKLVPAVRNLDYGPGAVAVAEEHRAGRLLGASPPGANLSHIARLVLPQPNLGGPTGYVQLFRSGGDVLHSGKGLPLPVTAATRAVAAGRRGAFFSDVSVDGTRVRMLTERALPDGVWQVALPLADLESTLGHLRLVLAIVCAAGIALATALGLLVSRAALIPVRRLTGAAARVAQTQDLGHRIEVADVDDELGRLSTSFNTMLAALERSRLAQRQLISDASHELRTPLTSVQANLDALALGDELPPAERARVLAAAQAQLRELTVLVGDLVDLSKTEVGELEVEDVRLDLAVASAVQRAQLHAPGVQFALTAKPTLVRAAPGRLDRAIANLLDNAVKWGPPRGPVEIRVRDGAVEVRDHGPGIAEEDLPRVFDRFYRSPAARNRPGSGLGLAIARHMAEVHGGAVHAANDPAGGARLTLELPPLEMTDAELLACQLDGAPANDAVQEVPRLP